MKDRWKNNLGIKIMAVLFAVLLWWTVVNIDDPVGTKKFQVEVDVLNAEVVTNEGKSYQIVNNTKNVTVTVKARRKVLDEIKSSNILATADFSELQGSSVPIRVKINGFEGDYEEAMANPRNLQIQTEITETKTFPITVATTGDVREGYVLDKVNTVAKPKSIEISGPKSSLGRIAKVVAKVDVSELSKDTTLSAEVIYYDSADNIIDKSLLSSNCDKNGVSVDVKLLSTKQLPVSFDTSKIIPGEGYVFSGITFEPQTILVAGKTDVLNAVTQIDVGAEALQKEAIVANEEVVVDVSPYLPQEISLVDEAAGSVVVTIVVEKAGAKTYEVCREVLDDIVIVPEGAVCTTIIQMYNKSAIVVEPAGALSSAALRFYADKIKGKKVACIVSGSNNDITRMEEIREKSLLYEGLKHYFIVEFPQKPGVIVSFINNVIGPSDDLVYIQYIKKTNKNFGPALIGIELASKEDFEPLIERMNALGIKYEYINENNQLFEILI